MRGRAASAVLLSLALGCGEEFPPASEISGLRVLAVQKSAPYAKPGEVVELAMLWHDATPEPETPVTITWLTGCTNPAGDLYQLCFEGVRDPLDGTLGVSQGDTATVQLPAGALLGRPAPGPGLPPFGLAYVFFAACAGTLGPLEVEPGAIPIGCFDSKGELRPPGRFVIGYSTIYVYEELQNANPIVGGLSIEGTVVPNGGTTPPFGVCADDGGESCPDIDLRPELDPSIAEIDPVGSTFEGRKVTEQMWINFYVDRGGIDPGVRLLNDASTGWNPDHGAAFRAPSTPGPVRLFAVVHDNRGGVGWVQVEVPVQ